VRKGKKFILARLLIGKEVHSLGRMTSEEWMIYVDQEIPVYLIKVASRTYWYRKQEVWWEDEGLNANQVYALILVKKENDTRRVDRATARVAHGLESDTSTRRPISDEVKQFVFVRDGGECVTCGSATEIQFDHIILIALGGSSEPENLQVLCGPCNRRKGSNLSSN